MAAAVGTYAPWRRRLALAGVVGVVSLVSLGVQWCVGMDTVHPTGSMVAACEATTPSGSTCTMDAVTHLSNWQQQFVATATPSSSASVLMLLAVLLFVASSYWRQYRDGEVAQATAARLYRRRRFNVAFLDYLREALSRGTIQPKVYPAAL